MSYYYDGNTLVTNGIINSDDYTAILNKYSSEIFMFSKNGLLVAQDSYITADQFNKLRNYIYSFNGAYYFDSLPGNVSVGSDIVATRWGQAHMNQKTITFTSNGSFVVPNGCYRMRVNNLVAGGGGGGCGSQNENGGSGGSGGSGGHYENWFISTTPGQTIFVTIGAGGMGGIGKDFETTNATNGGDSVIQMNGVEILRSYSGGPGLNAWTSGGSGGSGGYPGGSNGNNGPTGASNHTGSGATIGVQGASGPLGVGGMGGNSSTNWEGQNATGYGAGGGSGGNNDGANPKQFWSGGNGSPGYCQILYPA